MDLHDEFSRHAISHVSDSGSGERLRGADVRARLEARVTRGRRVHHAKVGVGTVAAVGVLAVGAVMVPRLSGGTLDPASQVPSYASDVPTPSASVPSPHPSEPASVDRPALPEASALPNPADLPRVGDENYLATIDALWQLTGVQACEAIAAEPYPGAKAEAGVYGSTVPVPSWLETGRLYGWGDDVLVGGYPIPVAPLTAEQAAMGGDADIEQFGRDAVLVITGADGVSWGYSVTWLLIVDPVHDEPGTFVELNDTYECGGDGVPPEGVYNARLAYLAADGTHDILELSPIQVVSGVPSLPEVDAAGR